MLNRVCLSFRYQIMHIIMHIHTRTLKTFILFLSLSNLAYSSAHIPLPFASGASTLQNAQSANSSNIFSNAYAAITTNINAATGSPYFSHLAAGGIVALGAGYYWYQKQLKKIDYTPNYDSDEPRYEIPGMIGACPPEIRPIIEQLKEDNKEISLGLIFRHEKEIDNVLLLEGPTGVGKTALAQAIAKNTDSHFVEIYGADVLDGFIGGSKAIINESIENAIAEGKAYKKRVIIFIDEIDAFSCNENSTARTEYDAAYKALWRHIDKNKNNPCVFFIFATNHLNRVPVELRNRVDLCIHMKNPDAQHRTELLDHFSEKYTQQKLDEYCSKEDIETLIRETKNFSVRNISNLCKHAHRNAVCNSEPIAQTHFMKELEKIKKEVALQRTATKEEQEKQRALNRDTENLTWNRINGIWIIMNIISKITST